MLNSGAWRSTGEPGVSQARGAAPHAGAPAQHPAADPPAPAGRQGQDSRHLAAAADQAATADGTATAGPACHHAQYDHSEQSAAATTAAAAEWEGDDGLR